MTWWCAGGSRWCFLLSKRCTIFQSSAFPHIQPAFLRTGGRWCDNLSVVVSLVWSRYRRKAQGRFQQRRGGCYLGRRKNPKVGKVKTGKQITYHVTAPMSRQLLKSRSDRSSFAKLHHRVLQKYPILQWENGQNKPKNQQN